MVEINRTGKLIVAILLVFLFSSPLCRAGIHLESDVADIAYTVGTADGIVHYESFRGSYSFQTPNGRYYVFFLKSNTNNRELFYSTTRDFETWYTFDTQPEIGIISYTTNNFQQIYGMNYAVECINDQYMMCVYYKENEPDNCGVFLRSGLIVNATGEILWLSELCLFNQTVMQDYRAYVDIARDVRGLAWIAFSAWNNTHQNYISVLEEVIPSSTTPYESYSWNPYGAVKTFFKLCPYRPLGAGSDVGFMYAFAKESGQTETPLRGSAFSQTGSEDICIKDQGNITNQNVTVWEDTSGYDFPFFSVVGEAEHGAETLADQQYIHLVYKNSTSNNPYGTYNYKVYDSTLGAWGSETVFYTENATYYTYIRHPHLTLIRPSSEGLCMLLAGSRPNGTENAHIYYFEYLNGAWGNFTELCSQQSDFQNVYHSEMLTEDVVGRWVENQNQTIAVYWSDDNTGTPSPPDNYIMGILAETDESYSYSPPAPTEEPPVTDVYTLPFIGLIGIILMVWSPTWVALNIRKKGFEAETIEKMAYAFLLFVFGFGLFICWIYA